MDDNELERMVRRVVREEIALSKLHGGSGRVVAVQAPPHSRKRTIEDEERSMENFRLADEHLDQIDPDGKLSQEERVQALRLQFPHWGL